VTREHPVEIAPIRQIAGVGDEAERVDHRHCQQGPVESSQRPQAQQPADDFDADDFVTVDRSTEKQHRPRLPSMHHVDRERHRLMRRQYADRQIDGAPGAGRHRCCADHERLSSGTAWRAMRTHQASIRDSRSRVAHNRGMRHPDRLT
jgi:hypothetical protein